MTNLDSMLKSRDITLPTMAHLVKAIVFPMVMLDARVGMWRKLSAEELMLFNCGVGEGSWESLCLQGDQTSKSYWIFIGKIDAEVEAPLLWPPMWRADSLEKILMLGKTEGRRRRGRQRMRWLDSITDSLDMNLSKLQEIVEDRGTWHAGVHGIAKSWTQLSDWTKSMQVSVNIPVG